MKIIRKCTFSFVHDAINADLVFDTSINELKDRAFEALSTKKRGLIQIISTKMPSISIYQDIPKFSPFFFSSFQSNYSFNEFSAEKITKLTKMTHFSAIHYIFLTFHLNFIPFKRLYNALKSPSMQPDLFLHSKCYMLTERRIY